MPKNTRIPQFRDPWSPFLRLRSTGTVSKPSQKQNIFRLYLFPEPMIEQFHKILRTPRSSPSQNLQRTQDLILSTFEQIFPETLDIRSLHRIYEQVLGPKAFPNQSSIQVSLEQQALLNYRLVEYFIQLVKVHFVNAESYRALEEQTQRAEATIRSHIKVEQEMKMYLEYLEVKIQKMQRQLSNLSGSPEHLRRELQIMQSRESLMQREKIGLIKKNENLKNQVEMLRRELENRASPRISIRSSFIGKKDGSGQRQPSQQNYLQMSGNSGSLKTSQNPQQKTSQKQRRDSFPASHHNNNVTQKKRSAYFPLELQPN